MQFGILIPHFGAFASRQRIVDHSQRIEELGYDSVWVRDHLVWHPHGMEGTDNTFVEPLLALAAIGAVTTKLAVGTGVLIPVRWPLKLAQDLASLSYLIGPRIIAGLGMGFSPSEFAASGFKYEQRSEIANETVQICRKVWTEDDVEFHGEVFDFEHFSLKPKPLAPIPMWYGGGTRASVRRAVAYFDGWIPGRLPMASIIDRLTLLRGLSATAGKHVAAGYIPLVKVGRTREEGWKDVDVPALVRSSEGSDKWIKPPSGEFETVADLEGLIVSGSPEDCIRQIQKLKDVGIDHLVLDFRLQFDKYEDALELFAAEVLPYVNG